MSQPKPYTISIPDSRIADLHARLQLANLPDELDTSSTPERDAWSYGAPLADIKRLVAYWKDGFDWRKAEAQLNEVPQFTTTVNVSSGGGFGDVDVHFVHQRSEVEGAIPLLFVHGWPGSYIEVLKLLPLLSKGTAGAPAFHIVAPSLPNYGWSPGIKKAGFAIPQYAETCHRLMLSLGYDKYVTQGGDWGFFITRTIGSFYPEHCLASHVNMVMAQPPKFSSNPVVALQHAITPYSEREKKGLERTAWFSREGTGYSKEQQTRPQTLGYALADSPVALLAWIYEKLHDWTDSYPWTDDEILTWISIYWFSTAGPAANIRIYYENIHAKDIKQLRTKMSGWVPHVKLGLAHFPKELVVVPKTWGQTMGPVVHESVSERGGHFAAWERPDVIADDLQKMFGKEGPCYGIVKGRTGYDKKAPRARL